jgi:ribose 5-phosphate isomerase A
MTDREAMKAAAGRAALGWVAGAEVLGVGTGSTVDRFLDALADSPVRPAAAVATSARTSRRLQELGIELVSLPEVGSLPVYVDGADEVDVLGRMIKGAGGALTMEKIVASASMLLVCIVDETKFVDALGDGGAPIPMQVLTPARELVLDRMTGLGAQATVRPTPAESGDLLIDVRGLDLADPTALEVGLDAIPGVVECGVFALRRADIVLIGGADGIVLTHRPPVR